MVTLDNVDAVMDYRPPTEGQLLDLAAIRVAAKSLVRTILHHAPPSADRSTAIRKVREAVKDANSAIVLRGIE